MQEKTKCFLMMFAIELEDLQEDIELLIKKYTEEHDQEVISNYVFLENLALMKNELFGLDSFLQEVKGVNPNDFQDVYQLIEFLKKKLLSRCHDKGIAAATFVLSERKITKVLSYVEHQALAGACSS